MTPCSPDQSQPLGRTASCQHRFLIPALISALLTVGEAFAQPAKNAGKFLGNITTLSQVRTDFADYWKNNPNPPNDFPKLFEPSTTIKYTGIPAPVRVGTFQAIDVNACAVFDLQGRHVGRYGGASDANRRFMARQLYLLRSAESGGHPEFINRIVE